MGTRLQTHWGAIWRNTGGYRISIKRAGDADGSVVRLDAAGRREMRAYGSTWDIELDVGRRVAVFERKPSR